MPNRRSRDQLHRTHTNMGYSYGLLDKYGMRVAQEGNHRSHSAPAHQKGRPIFGGPLSLELTFSHVAKKALPKQPPARTVSKADLLHQVSLPPAPAPVPPHFISSQVGATFDEHGSWRNYEPKSYARTNEDNE